MKLVSILLEILGGKPKAIFLAGAAGSGKSTIINKIIPNLEDFYILNLDTFYEKLLKKGGLGLKIDEFDHEKLSQAAKYMGQAQKAKKEKYEELKGNLKNFIIDGTGASVKPLLKQKKELEDMGYETYMIALYVSPITSLERNLKRGESGRSLLPQIVLRTWRDYTQNIEIYRKEFGENFSLVSTEENVDHELKIDKQEIKKKFFKPIKTKPKTPQELEKKKKEVKKLYDDIEFLVKKEHKIEDLNKAKNKIYKFLNR